MDEAHTADQVFARVNASDAVSIINAASGYSAATNGIFPDRVLKRDFTKVTQREGSASACVCWYCQVFNVGAWPQQHHGDSITSSQRLTPQQAGAKAIVVVKRVLNLRCSLETMHD